MNNARFGKTRQKIIAVMGNKSDANIDEIGLKSGILIVKVPNIEHYWMGDMVTLPGMSAPMKVMHRWGKSTFTTWDCDRVFVDQRIYPAGNHDKGRGCSLAYSFYAGGNTVSPSAGGNKEGLNIRALGGEGWLYFNIPYTTAHQAMVGGFVDLSNPIYINSQGQVTTTNTTTTPPAGSTTAGGTTPDTGTITPIKSTMASLATPLSIVILAGIGSTFIYQAIKNQQ